MKFSNKIKYNSTEPWPAIKSKCKKTSVNEIMAYYRKKHPQ